MRASTGSWVSNIGKHSFVLIALAFLSLRLLFVGDMSFLGDEAMLLMRALDLNESGTWAAAGLLGTKGVIYGPMATWIYQVLLRISLNLDVLIFIKIIFESALQVWGVWELKKIFPRWPDFSFLLVFMSPYFFFYSRMFWDNTFNISFSLLLFTGTCLFIKAPSFWRLLRIAVFTAMCLSIHLMSGSLILTLFIWLLLQRWRYLLKNFHQVVLSLAAMILILWPYLHAWISNPTSSANSTHGILSLKPLEIALLGTRPLTGLGLNYFYGKGFSWFEFSLVYLLGILGVVLVALFFWSLGALFFSRRRLKYRASLNEDAEGLGVAQFATIFFWINLVVCFLTRVSHHPHYFNASWVPFWILTAYGFVHFSENKNARRRRWAQFYEPLYVCVAFVALLSLISLVHQNHGARSTHHGPSRKHFESVVDEIILRGINPQELRFEPEWLAGYSDSIRALYRLETQRKPQIATGAPTRAGTLKWFDLNSESDPRLQLVDSL
jgi:hypothetical protein